MTNPATEALNRSVHLEAVVKVVTLIAVILPSGEVFARFVALGVRFAWNITLATSESLPFLTAAGVHIIAPGILLAGTAYYILGPRPNHTQTHSPSRPRLRAMVLAAAVIGFVLTSVLPGFPAIPITFGGTLTLGALLGFRRSANTVSFSDLMPLIVGAALITAVATGIGGMVDASAGDFTFSSDANLVGGSYVEVASTAENLLYVTPCNGPNTLVAVRFDEINRVAFRTSRWSPSLVELIQGRPPSFGYQISASTTHQGTTSIG